MNRTLALFRMRFRTIANAVRSLRRESSLKMWFITCFLTVFWFGLLFLFLDGFSWLKKYSPVPGLNEQIIHYLFALYFLSLSLMLTFSNAIIIYVALYRARETTFLMTLPLKSDQVYAYRFFETIAFSSWAFLLLGAPILIAYGISEKVPLMFYPVTVIAMVPFAVLNSALGCLITMIIVTLFPQSKKKLVMGLILLVIILAVFLSDDILRLLDPTIRNSPDAFINNVLGKFRFSQAPLLPSYWLTRLVHCASIEKYRQALFHFGYIVSTAMMLYFIGLNFAAWTLRANYSLVQGGRKKKLYKSRLFEKILWGLFFFVNREIRSFLVKDVKTFKRDAVQWSQFLIFFGIISLYILNLKNFGYDEHNIFWKSLVSFLNLTATALTLATFTSRFVFPLISLEGRNFWVLGLSPISRTKILIGKFIFALFGSIIVSEILIIASDVMLKTHLSWLVLHAGTMLIICFGLSGLAVGLGARFPSFHEENPSKIVSGFGGTLTLILSIFFLVVVIVLLTVPSHIYFTTTHFSLRTYRNVMKISVTAALMIGAVACVVPLYLGIRSFKKVEF